MDGEAGGDHERPDQVYDGAFLWPRSVGRESRVKGRLEGLKRTGKLYLLIILTLAIAAIYEVIEVVFILPLL